MIYKYLLLFILIFSQHVMALDERVLNASTIKNGAGRIRISTSAPTASRACVINSNGEFTSATTTSAELDFISGLTSAVQTQLDGKAASSHTHSIYATLAGIAGGQTLIGGSASGENLTLQSTSHATKGKVIVNGAFAQGSNQTVSTVDSFSLGQGNNVSGTMSGALGASNVASGAFGAVAIGNSNQATGQAAVAIGLSSESKAVSSITMGTRALAPVGANGAIVMADTNPDGVSTTDTAGVVDGFLTRFKGGYRFRKGAASGPQYSLYQATVNVTDATVTSCGTFTTASSKSYLIETRIAARRTGGSSGTAGDTAVYVVRALAKNIAGTLTVSSATADYTAEDQAGWDATIDGSGTDVRVRITGATNNNVTWNCTLIIDEV